MLCTLHQADNLAKLWQEFLSLLELIAKIFCAVSILKIVAKAMAIATMFFVSI